MYLLLEIYFSLFVMQKLFGNDALNIRVRMTRGLIFLCPSWLWTSLIVGVSIDMAHCNFDIAYKKETDKPMHGTQGT